MSVGPASVFSTVLFRDLKVAFRRWSDLANPLLFFVLVTALFPLALSPEPEFLRAIAPGVLWIAAVLAMLMSLNVQYRADIEDGVLEQLLLLPQPLPVVALAKVVAHWLTTGLPLVLMAPVMAVTYHLPATAMAALVLTLLIGTPTLSLIGAIGSALTGGLRQGGALLALMITPLLLPVLMIGARATDMAVSGQSPAGPLYLLAALLCLAIVLAPVAIGFAARIAVD